MLPIDEPRAVPEVATSLPDGADQPEWIDWLRGVAAVGVALFHARVPLWVGWREIAYHGANYSAFDRFCAGLSFSTPFLGSLVMLFFVISGFCVHRPVVSDGAPFDVGRFYLRRFWRIYPPYAAAALLSFALGSIWVFAPSGAPHLLATLLMAQNYTEGVGTPVLAAQPSVNPALWSLPVEMELYLMYPLFRASVRRWGWAPIMGVVGLVSGLAALAVHRGAYVLEGNFALHWIVWCAGAWLRERYVSRQLGNVPLVASVAAWIVLALGGWLTLVSIGGVRSIFWGLFYAWLLWICLVHGHSFISRGRGMTRLGGSLGRWSYSIYLLHFPVLFALGAAWVAWRGHKPSNFLIPVLGCVFCIPCAALFSRWIEQPAHRVARRFGPATSVSVRNQG